MKDETLALYITQFICEKHALGYKYQTEEYLINSFLRFVSQNKIENCLKKEGLFCWIDTAPTPLMRNRRITILRQFVKFLQRHNEFAYYIPDTAFSMLRKNFCPYIFTEKEIANIFYAADRFGHVGHIPYSDISFPLILRILYGCGLRISEALSLKVCNVDFNKGILLIEDTKFFKSRLVPMHDNLTKCCLEYMNQVHVLSCNKSWLFPSHSDDRISNGSFYGYFRKLLDICKIRSLQSPKGARVHDMRHTFAVHCLKKLDSKGTDMNVVLPILATYMGHTTYEGTGTYLRLTPDLYPQINSKVYEEFHNIIPWEDNN